MSDKKKRDPRIGRQDTKVRLHDIHNPPITKLLVSGPALDVTCNRLQGLAVCVACQKLLGTSLVITNQSPSSFLRPHASS